MSRQNVTAYLYDKKGNLLCTGQNSYTKTHPKQAKYAELTGNRHKIYLHAEIAALVRCREQPYRIHVERIKKDGTLGIAKPCQVCMMAIEEAGVSVITYSS